MISSKKALESAQTLVDYCQQQRSCQNCIFRKFGCEHWDCHIISYDLQDVISNIEAKKKHGGYI